MANYKEVLSSCVNLLFPPLCLHCRHTLQVPGNPLCDDCLLQMEIIDPQERCLYCFGSLDESLSRICPDCYCRYPAYHRIASVFNYDGPFASLIRHFKYQDKPWLSKGISSYLYYQLLKLDWPIPDFIVPMPICWAHWIERGYNQCLLLAQELGKLLNIPVLDVVKRKSTEFSQAGKNRWQRRMLPIECFSIHSKLAGSLKNSRILLIDDVITTGRSVECCAEVLSEHSPEKIYVLTACRAVD